MFGAGRNTSQRYQQSWSKFQLVLETKMSIVAQHSMHKQKVLDTTLLMFQIRLSGLKSFCSPATLRRARIYSENTQNLQKFPVWKQSFQEMPQYAVVQNRKWL